MSRVLVFLLLSLSVVAQEKVVETYAHGQISREGFVVNGQKDST